MTPKEFAKKIIQSINPGTADISGIGDGTIKGAISEQNKNLNCRYNSETDMLEIYYNGVWNEWKPAGMQKFDFIAHTTLSDWELTNVNMTYSVDIIEKILFDSTNINSSASTATGQENCRATCKTPIILNYSRRSREGG